MTERRYLPNSKECFVCGEENSAGLQARFYVEGEVVKVPFRARRHHTGYPGAVHGGVVAAAMDECMAWAATRVLERMCVTAELTLRYVRRVPPETDLTVCATIMRAHRRLVQVHGSLVDGDGTEYVWGDGRFMPLSPEETLRVDDGLLYHGGEERIFDELRRDKRENP